LAIEKNAPIFEIKKMIQMNQKIFNLALPHIIAVVLFVFISCAYFSPILQGKQLKQLDVMKYMGASKEAMDYKEIKGRQALWTNSMFGGMPTYIITHVQKLSLIHYSHQLIQLFMTKPINLVFLYLLGFYLALLIFGVNPWLSIAGSVAYAFSSYFFIIIEPGHITKAIALGYMPPIIAGFYLAYNRKMFLGAIVFTLFLAMQILINHLQITYYTFMMIGALGVFELIKAVKEKLLLGFAKTSGVLLIGVLLAVLSNISGIWTTYEYSHYSIRGPSELIKEGDTQTKGLDKDYITAWSYGIDETLTLLIPNFKGGSSTTKLDKNSATYEFFKRNYGNEVAKQASESIPTYWGTQPFTSGPVYLGASVLLIFMAGLFLVKGYLKWWIVSISILSILLAWGRNFMPLTDLFLDFFPGYNKFRAVTTILIIVEFAVPLLAIITIDKILKEEFSLERIKSALKKSLIILGSITLFLSLFGGGLFSFSSEMDGRLLQAGYPVDEIMADRASMLKGDAFRSLIFIIIAAGLVFLTATKKIKNNIAIILFGAIFLIDMWPVNKRYINDSHFANKRDVEIAYRPTQADLLILEDKDPNFRVFNVAVNTFNDASTSYFHKSIGGYSAAKMQRYQEVIEEHISKNNMEVLNMLNTKYFIVPDKEGGPMPQKNPYVLGNSWFVENIIYVPNANAEIEALNNFNPSKDIIIDERYKHLIEGFSINPDPEANIKLISYNPENLVYESNTQSEQLAVFSEIFYSKGWNAYINGEIFPHFRANYILRAMKVPSGNNTIEFRFEPKSYYIGEIISFSASLIMMLLFALIIFGEIRKNKMIKS